MRRPGTVIVIAVLQFIGSAGALGFGLLFLLGVAVITARTGQALTAGAVIGDAVFFLVFVAWGIATGVGLLGMRIWAIVSTLLYSGLLALFGLAMLAGASLATSFTGVPVQPAQRALLFAGAMVTLGIAAWWITYFSLPRTRAHFYNASPVAAGRRRVPLSILVIGWELIALGGGIAIPAAFFGHLSVVEIAGRAITGAAIRPMFILAGAISLAIGIGLVRVQAWARKASLVWLVLYLLSSALTWLAPGVMPQPGEGASANATLVTLLLLCVPTLIALYYLTARKAVFAPPAPPPETTYSITGRATPG